MILKYEYRSTSQFSSSVNSHAFLLRCKPYESLCQRIVECDLEIDGCGGWTEQRDSFGNSIIFGSIDTPHDKFCVRSCGTVEVSECQQVADVCNPVFCYPSPLVFWNGAIADFASHFRCSDPAKTVLSLCNAVHDRIEYKSGSTDNSTDSVTVFNQQFGVCQDFSHVLIAMLRSLKIPARYVAGYVRGLQLSHAWTEVYYDGSWHGVDATENITALDGYIKIAHGRDASDCPLNRGIFCGSVVEEDVIEIKVGE